MTEATTAGGSVLSTADGPIGRLTLNRPAAMNAITVELGRELELGLRRLAQTCAVIVIRGAGGNFCAGGDFAEVERLRAAGPEALLELFENFRRACAVISELDVPVVAAVEGNAMAGGFELMQACDIALVHAEARIADNHANFGMIPGGGGSQRLPRLAGRQRALAHIMTGDRLSGTEAVAWGLAYRSFPDAEFDSGVETFVRDLAGKNRASIATIKRLVHRGLEMPLRDGLAMEVTAIVDHICGPAGGAAIHSFAGRRDGGH